MDYRNKIYNMDYRNKIYNMDCIAGMSLLPDGCVDMVLTDLPYGMTDCPWDSIIPFPALWQQLNRVLKPNGAVVMTAAQPFTTALINSNRKQFRYCWYWHKNQVTGFPFSHVQPLRCVEDIVVFYRKTRRGWWLSKNQSGIAVSDTLTVMYTGLVAWNVKPCASLQTIPGRC